MDSEDSEASSYSTSNSCSGCEDNSNVNKDSEDITNKKHHTKKKKKKKKEGEKKKNRTKPNKPTSKQNQSQKDVDQPSNKRNSNPRKRFLLPPLPTEFLEKFQTQTQQDSRLISKLINHKSNQGSNSSNNNNKKTNQQKMEKNQKKKLRSLPIKIGVFSFFVYIKVPKRILVDFQKNAYLKLKSQFNFLSEENFFKYKDKELHISVIETIEIQHHHIQPLIKDIRELIVKGNYCSFDCNFSSNLHCFTNPDRLKSFICLLAKDGEAEIKKLITDIQKTLTEYQLNTSRNYNDYLPHVSLLWGNDDLLFQKKSQILNLLNFTSSSFKVKNIRIAVAKKIYKINLF
ncbi:hypothetical protein M0812_14196 [Anaeramoeba flamelloides]|uniref:U6 snRNA phosphodiesterase 1 n=1 Tax=Anaeramoeba flamelloides TaxID=1746091 RepID=A0AAV7ZET0_9EUKA|nr:hypothetical protein M0812_14196 [Anaeramoeba flamelloides]